MTLHATPNERAGNFLLKLANQDRVTVSMNYSAARPETSRKMLNALKVMVPALAVVASAHAKTPTPEVLLQTNGPEHITVQSVTDIIEQARSLTADSIQKMGMVAKCLKEHLNIDHPVDEKLMLTMMNTTAKTSIEIENWAQKTGFNSMLGVAAYCQNPENWEAQAQSWINKTSKYDALEGSVVRKELASQALRGLYERTTTTKNAFAEAAGVQKDNPGQFYGASAIKVGAMDWLSAASSVAQGAAELMGNDGAKDYAKTAERVLRDGGNYVRRGKSALNRSDSAAKIKGVGDLLKSVGQRVGNSNKNRNTVRNPF